MTDRTAILGCGKQKLDLSGEKGPVAISRLYTSNYFELKREYAKTCCDRYFVLSAKHGLVLPGYYVEDDYDLTIEDLDEEDLTAWVADVSSDLGFIADHSPEDTLVILAGEDYWSPLHGVLEQLPNPVEYTFDGSTGIGEQMGLLKDEIEAAKQGDEPTNKADDDGQAGLERWSA